MRSLLAMPRGLRRQEKDGQLFGLTFLAFTASGHGLDSLGRLCTHFVCVRLIKEKFLRDSAEQYPKAAKYLAAWVKTVRAAEWRNLTDVRASYPSADLVQVASKKPVIVFNVCGNTYRLIVAMHFDRQTAYPLRFFTHAGYSKDKWKDEL